MILDTIRAEQTAATKLLAVRYQEYRESVLGLGYNGCVERLHSAIARYERADKAVKEYDNKIILINLP